MRIVGRLQGDVKDDDDELLHKKDADGLHGESGPAFQVVLSKSQKKKLKKGKKAQAASGVSV